MGAGCGYGGDFCNKADVLKYVCVVLQGLYGVKVNHHQHHHYYHQELLEYYEVVSGLFCVAVDFCVCQLLEVGGMVHLESAVVGLLLSMWEEWWRDRRGNMGPTGGAAVT